MRILRSVDMPFPCLNDLLGYFSRAIVRVISSW